MIMNFNTQMDVDKLKEDLDKIIKIAKLNEAWPQDEDHIGIAISKAGVCYYISIPSSLIVNAYLSMARLDAAGLLMHTSSVIKTPGGHLFSDRRVNPESGTLEGVDSYALFQMKPAADMRPEILNDPDVILYHNICDVHLFFRYRSNIDGHVLKIYYDGNIIELPPCYYNWDKNEIAARVSIGCADSTFLNALSNIYLKEYGKPLMPDFDKR